MKRIICCTILTFAFISAAFRAEAQAQTMSLDMAIMSASANLTGPLERGTRITVLPVETQSAEMTHFITDGLKLELMNMQGFVVTSTAVNARFVISGSLVPVGANHLFTAQVVDTNTNAILRVFSVNVQHDAVAAALLGGAAPAQVAVAAPPPRHTLGLPLEMARIPAGTFMMGSPAGELRRDRNEGPQRQVTLSAFYISRFAVTRGQWSAVMQSEPRQWVAGNDNLPATHVSWYDAIVFANRLSMQRGLTPAYEIQCASNNQWTTDVSRWGTIPTGSNARWNNVRVVSGSTGYRLPTEAQWEHAARAGTTTPWNTGATITRRQANYGGGGLMAVGSFASNAWGLYDMHGNVWEWVWDWFGTYPSVAQTDPTGPTSGTDRVVRGGSWGSIARVLRSARRHVISPALGWDSLGFRLVRP